MMPLGFSKMLKKVFSIFAPLFHKSTPFPELPSFPCPHVCMPIPAVSKILRNFHPWESLKMELSPYLSWTGSSLPVLDTWTLSLNSACCPSLMVCTTGGGGTSGGGGGKSSSIAWSECTSLVSESFVSTLFQPSWWWRNTGAERKSTTRF